MRCEKLAKQRVNKLLYILVIRALRPLYTLRFFFALFFSRLSNSFLFFFWSVVMFFLFTCVFLYRWNLRRCFFVASSQIFCAFARLNWKQHVVFNSTLLLFYSTTRVCRMHSMEMKRKMLRFCSFVACAEVYSSELKTHFIVLFGRDFSWCTFQLLVFLATNKMELKKRSINSHSLDNAQAHHTTIAICDSMVRM